MTATSSPRPSKDPLADSIFALGPMVRYVAILRQGELALAQRPGLANASSSDSDRYEELLVNPTLLAITKARGDIDCGGREYVIVRYGGFFQLVHPIAGGHVSIAIEPDANPLDLVPALRRLLAR